MPRCGATFDENESPPPEGCRGGLFRREDPPLKAKACSFLKAALPLPRGDFQRGHSCWGLRVRGKEPGMKCFSIIVINNWKVNGPPRIV